MNYEESNRGKIQFPQRMRQVVNFDGCKFGTITPTDIDAIIDYKNKAWVIIEAKLNGVPVPRGQILAFERQIDDLSCSGKKAICIVADHNVSDPSTPIVIADCIVRQIYYNSEWRTIRKTWTVKKLLDWFFAQVDVS